MGYSSLVNCSDFRGEILRIAGLIQDRLPHQNRRMVAVTTDDFTGILEHTLGKIEGPCSNTASPV